MDLTLKEAIQLIVDFRHIRRNFWKELSIEDPLVRRFIDAGYAILDEEYPEKYVLNKNGEDFLHTYIKQISTTFIEFLKKNGFSCYNADAIHWFSCTYSLDDEIAECLYDYIARNLKVYGLEPEKFYQSGHGWGCQFKKVDA